MITCDGYRMQVCQQPMTHLCSACSRVTCSTCVTKHKGNQECRLFSLNDLHDAWVALKKRCITNNPNVMNCLLCIREGTLINQPAELKSSEVSNFIANVFGVFDKFDIGKNYLRSAYLFPLRRQQRIDASQPSAGHLSNEKQAEATTILRLWMTALEVKDRAAAHKKAVSLISGQPTVEDAAMELKKSHPKSRVPVFKEDTTSRDFLRFQKIYQQHVNQVELMQTAWQNVSERGLALTIANREHHGMTGQVDLVIADPFYGVKYQPTISEQAIVRRMFDNINQFYRLSYFW